jgi:L-ascorbate metabolism protein UlaG (beta-lactamase superfamily)
VTDVETPGRTQMTFLGHATFRLSTPEGREVIIDPWTYRNPLCPPDLRNVGPIDLALVTHAHHDHIGDIFSIARDARPRIVAVAELGHWMLRRGLHRVQTMNLGGVLELDDVEVVMTPAAHSSSLDDEPEVNAGVAAGFVLGFSDGLRVYHAGDTAAFAGMALVGEVHRPDVALLPMGDHHTMGPVEAAAATRLLGVRRVVPMHYGIEPGSDDVPQRFRAALDRAGLQHVEVLTMRPGDTAGWDPGGSAFT